MGKCKDIQIAAYILKNLMSHMLPPPPSLTPHGSARTIHVLEHISESFGTLMSPWYHLVQSGIVFLGITCMDLQRYVL